MNYTSFNYDRNHVCLMKNLILSMPYYTVTRLISKSKGSGFLFDITEIVLKGVIFRY